MAMRNVWLDSPILFDWLTKSGGGVAFLIVGCGQPSPSAVGTLTQTEFFPQQGTYPGALLLMLMIRQ